MGAIPKEWCQAAVSDIGDVVSGGTPSTKIEKYWSGDIRWITPADLSGYSRKLISQGRKNITPEGVKCSSARLVPAGTVLFSSRAPVGYVAIAEGPLCTNQGFKNLVPFTGVDSNFLYYYFKSIKGLANSLATGTTFKELSGKAFAALPVVVAPLVEQRAIVAKIEALFSELDKGVEQLETLRGQLKRYRQSVLKAAFDGKLTAKWRTERAQPFVQDREQLKVAETPETYGTKKHPPLTEDELAELPELPEGWRWVRLGSLIEHPQYGTSKKCRSDGKGLSVLRIPNISDGRVKADELKYAVFTEEEQRQYALKVNDVLVIRSNGSVTLVGHPALIGTKDTHHLFAGYLIRLRPFAVTGSYLVQVLMSHGLRLQIEDKAKSTSGVNNINTGELCSLIIPLAPPSEQHQIVTEIEARFSALDQLEQTVEAGLRQAEALRQSILKKAFEGRLLSASELATVRADADYEPVARLLERIRAERTAQSGQGGQRGRATKSRSLSTPSTPSTSSTPPTPKRRPGP